MSGLKGGVVAVGLLSLVLAGATAGKASAQTEHQQILNKLTTLPPAWSQITGAANRFKLVLQNQAVLDLETGLVWEKTPESTSVTWQSAVHICQNSIVGSRKGWRMPTVEELASLVAPTRTNPSLPQGHPFTNVQNALYWSITPSVFAAADAIRIVNFGTGEVATVTRGDPHPRWCVRGGQGTPLPFSF